MDDILKTLIGTLAGVLVAILTIWLRERAERRRKINEWFESIFLFNAIEPLLYKARGVVTNIALGTEGLSETFDDDTRAQIERINQLLRDDKFGILWACASFHLKHKEYEAARVLFHGLSVSLRDLQDAALKTSITNRRTIFTLADNPAYKKVLEGLEEGMRFYEHEVIGK